MTTTRFRPARITRLMLLPTVAAVLAACGGGDTESLVAVPARGSVVSAAVKVQLGTAQIDAATTASGLQALSGTAACGVEVRHVVYNTRDPLGAQATASTAVMVPTGTAAACTGARPVLLYAHGTSTDKAKNMADVAGDGEAGMQMAMFAAQGFIVVAPNYLGYTDSSLSYHPYLNAEAQAVDMIDGLRAAKAHLATVTTAVQPSAKLLLSGYSQGGHVAMATHKVIERDNASEFTVTASGPMSGPYNMVGFGDTVVNVRVNAGATLFSPMVLTSYQRAYGNIYAKATDAYQAAYAATAENLLPSTKTVNTLIAEGKLPADPTFTALFGTGGLLTDSFKAGYATSNYRAALQTNTLLGWTPKRPMALCGGAGDPTVFWAVNSPVAQADFAARGVVVPTFDLEAGSTVATTDPTYPVYAGFAQAKANTAAQAVAAGATDAGANAVLGAYHGSLVPPFCTALVRGYFQQVLASGL
jgi:hypothetical protein